MNKLKAYLFEDVIESMQLGTSALGGEDNFGIPLLKMGNIRIGGFDFEKLEKLKEENFNLLSAFVLTKGDFLFNTRNTLDLVGKSSVWNNQLPIAAFNSNIMRIKFKKGIDDFYLGYYFSHGFGWNEFKRIATGTTSVAAIYSRDLLKCKVYLPDYKTQRQIATILSTADAVIEKTQAAIAKYKAIKQGMLQDLFTRGIDTTTGKLRPSYQVAPELYKESKLGWIPKEWEVERLGNRAVIEYGKSQKTVVSINGTIPVYGTGGLMEYATDFLFDGESILIGRKGTIDKPFYIRGKFWSVDTAYYLSSFTGNVRWLHSQLEFYNLKRLNEATGVPSINRVLLYNIQLSFPNKIEQDEIVKRILSIDKKLQTEQDFLHKQQQIKAGLMNDLLSGRKKLVVQEASLTQTKN